MSVCWEYSTQCCWIYCCDPVISCMSCLIWEVVILSFVQLIFLSLLFIRISIRAGAHFHDLTEVELIDLYEPNGWVHIPLRDRNDRMVKAFMLQVKFHFVFCKIYFGIKVAWDSDLPVYTQDRNKITSYIIQQNATQQVQRVNDCTYKYQHWITGW